MSDLTFKEKAQIVLLVGGACVGAFVLQNFEGWHAKHVLAKTDPQIVSAKVVSINLIPSNTGTGYVVSVELEKGERAKLIASSAVAKSCEVGETIQVEKRGLDYRFAKTKCGVA